MNYTEIIEEIKGGLSGDTKEDMVYLEKQAMKYKSHKLAPQIIDAISKMAFDILPEERREEINQALYYKGKRLDAVFNEAKMAADVHDYTRANKLMTGIIGNVEKHFLNIKDKTFKSLRNPLEEYLYMHLFKPEKKPHKPPFDLSEMYRFNGYVLIEMKKVDEAIDSLGKAITLNPLNTDAYFELGEAYKIKRNWEMLFFVTKDILTVAISTRILARCYANFGFYCIETEDYQSAVCFYYQSMRCEENPAIVGELNIIRQKTGKDIERPSDAAIEAAFGKYNLKPGANQEVINVAYGLAKYAIERKEIKFAKYCLSIVCDLTDDEDVKKLYSTVKNLK